MKWWNNGPMIVTLAIVALAGLCLFLSQGVDVSWSGETLT